MKMYLVLSADKAEFAEACKRFKTKCNELTHYVNSNPLFAFRSRKKAIKECQKRNNFKPETEIDFLMSYDKIYYIKEISIY